ncbi:MAG TPA: peptidoglycan editing factor PgeF [Candidatus Acidoferrales bacterium]|nr:peptidoglycan editing factor PgeF [Candidatus Acidoferrales bacterium]
MDIQPESQPVAAVPILRAWEDPELCAGFVGRLGGTSAGEFATMNLSYWVGDHESAVDENWRRLREQVPALKLVARLNQVHGNVVHAVTRETAALRPAGDGMVTDEPGVMLGIFSADCVPLLMVDAKRKIAGAFHCGWRGVIADVATVGVDAMRRLGARVGDLRAAIGPSIGPCCFEVDATLAERFCREIPAATEYARAGRSGKAYLDLRAIVTSQLVRAGLAPEHVASVGPCTRCASAQFFSRRAAGGRTTGLQMSFVGFSD